MRLVVISFALLAGVKVWTQDRMYREVMSEALVSAYRERAIAVCQKSETGSHVKNAPGRLASNAAAEIVIGNPKIDVALWDLHNPLWDVRYRHPHLVLTSAGQTRPACAYDLTVGLANMAEP